MACPFHHSGKTLCFNSDTMFSINTTVSQRKWPTIHLHLCTWPFMYAPFQWCLYAVINSTAFRSWEIYHLYLGYPFLFWFTLKKYATGFDIFKLTRTGSLSHECPRMNLAVVLDRPHKAELNPAVLALDWLLGTWESDEPGEGSFSSIPPFRYNETLQFSQVGQPVINFTWVWFNVGCFCNS